jgi:GNAT superfamily N-acetyltransferase
MVSIRRASGQDAGAIAHVHVQSWRTTYAGIVPEEYLAGLKESERTPLWQDWLSRDTPVFVAEKDGEVVGFASGGKLREPLEDYDAELFAIYLLERAQRQGIGTALLRCVAEWLRTQGFKSMAVWVLADNLSVGFYEESGAQRISSKEIEIGGVVLAELALGWPQLVTIAPPD